MGGTRVPTARHPIPASARQIGSSKRPWLFALLPAHALRQQWKVVRRFDAADLPCVEFPRSTRRSGLSSLPLNPPCEGAPASPENSRHSDRTPLRATPRGCEGVASPRSEVVQPLRPTPQGAKAWRRHEAKWYSRCAPRPEGAKACAASKRSGAAASLPAARMPYTLVPAKSKLASALHGAKTSACT